MWLFGVLWVLESVASQPVDCNEQSDEEDWGWGEEDWRGGGERDRDRLLLGRLGNGESAKKVNREYNKTLLLGNRHYNNTCIYIYKCTLQ